MGVHVHSVEEAQAVIMINGERGVKLLPKFNTDLQKLRIPLGDAVQIERTYIQAVPGELLRNPLSTYSYSSLCPLLA